MRGKFRGSPIFQAQNVLTGDAAAGAAYFNGEGKCATCHTATALNLAGIGARQRELDNAAGDLVVDLAELMESQP